MFGMIFNAYFVSRCVTRRATKMTRPNVAHLFSSTAALTTTNSNTDVTGGSAKTGASSQLTYTQESTLRGTIRSGPTVQSVDSNQTRSTKITQNSADPTYYVNDGFIKQQFQ